jgi:hypothetical protein
VALWLAAIPLGATPDAYNAQVIVKLDPDRCIGHPQVEWHNVNQEVTLRSASDPARHGRQEHDAKLAGDQAREHHSSNLF